MDSSYVPQSPDLSYTPQSPDLSGTGFRPESPDLTSLGSPRFANFNSAQHSRFPSAFGANNTSAYQPTSTSLGHARVDHQMGAMPPRQMKTEDEDEYMPDARPQKRGRRVKQEPTTSMNGIQPALESASTAIKSEDSDPTLGCKLTTSFPVARIKRIMQADEDIGKVAQVTPTVVSRALELFMIKLISAAANQARGPAQAGVTKAPRRVLAQHLKKAIVADEKFDFLGEIVQKVGDAPTKGKKDNGDEQDSEDTKPKKRGKKRKDSGDDI